VGYPLLRQYYEGHVTLNQFFYDNTAGFEPKIYVNSLKKAT